jgi:hypothetical protein
MARNHRKLIQTAIDGVTPPLPFNQIQYAELTGWRGEADHPGWVKVKRSLEDLCGPRVGGEGPRPAPPPVVPKPAPPPPAAPPPPPPAPAASRWPLFAGIGIGVVALAVAGGMLLGQRGAVPAPAALAPAASASAGAAAPSTPAAEAEAPVEQASVAADEDLPPPNPADMTIADSSTRLIQPHEIAMMGPSTLKVARNEIYARKGRRFVDPWLRDWFSRYAWYRPRYDEVPLNPIEKQNVELIGQAEAKYGG